jgi:hypothetical protein
MAKFYTATCTNMGGNYTRHNKIAKTLNNSAHIQSWVSPQNGHYLLRCTADMTTGQIRDMITDAAHVSTFVTPFNPNAYGYSLPSDNCHDVDRWIARHGPAFEKPFKIKENGCIDLKKEFQNQSIQLENGCTIQISENGEIHIEEKGKNPHKVRNKDDITGKLIF